jgi:hypothetical protein
MKNFLILKDKFHALSKRGKMITIFVAIIAVLILLDSCG